MNTPTPVPASVPGASELLRIVSANQAVLPRTDLLDAATLESAQQIITTVRTQGRQGLLACGRRFGDLSPAAAGDDSGPLLLGPDVLRQALSRIAPQTRALLERVAGRIETFARAQRAAVTDLELPVPGGVAGHTVTPVRRAACYAPGGRYPLPSTVLMTVLAARAAGVPEVYVLSPRPGDLMLAGAAIAGADGVLPVGGAHAIAAAAYGVELPVCDVVVGPGNRFVTAAKKLLVGTIGIDMLAGPSEVLIIADDTADARTIAADMLAQAEHDTDASAVLLSTDASLIERVGRELSVQLATLPTRVVAEAALRRNSFAAICRDIGHAAELAARIAPEHLEVHTRDAEAVTRQVGAYGGAFIGSAAAEVIGDYGIGPNHTLPTSGTARFTGGLSVLHFLAVRTFIRIDNPAAAQGVYADSAALAELEGLAAHRRSAQLRQV